MANEMRDKLFELLTDCEIEYAQYLSEECDKAIKGDVTKQLFKRLEFYADHLIANGVIVPPCKVGDRVYSINVGDEKTLKIWIEPNGDKITQIKINRGGYHFKCWWGYFHISDIGKTVFLTKSEAEQKLKEMRDKQNA